MGSISRMEQLEKPFDMIKRAFHIVRRTPALWWLAMLYAVAGGKAVLDLNFGSGFNYRAHRTNHWAKLPDVNSFLQQNWIAILLLGGSLILLLSIIFLVVNLLSDVALLNASNQVLQEQTLPSFWQSLQKSWNRKMWHLFLAQLIIDVPLFLLIALLIGLPILSIVLIVTSGRHFATPGAGAIIFLVIAGIIALLLFILFMIVLAIVVGLWSGFTKRFVVLSETKPMAAVCQGWNLMWSKWRSILNVWLLALAAAIGWDIATLLVLGLLVVLIGSTAGLITFLSGQGFHFFGNIWLGLLLGVPFIGLPALYLRSLYLAFDAVLWTDVFQQLIAPPWIETPNEPEPEFAPEPVKGDYLPPRYV